MTEPRRAPLANPLLAMQEALQRTQQWHGHQMAGRRWPVACVSLEITQRCNLDCTLCYLSESSEAVRDLPLEEVYRRIELIHAHYGPGTDVQVSGGEPTLRRRDELVAIVRQLTRSGLRATLLTNGIKASRELLAELCDAGLTDVAFHVDTTQQRAGYASEEALNEIRLEYIERARGLALSVFFNTTVHSSNFHELPMLANFFMQHAAAVRFASFQLQAETGRGVLGTRADPISNESVAQRLRAGVALPDLRFNVLAAGHQECNRSAVLLVINRRAYDAFAETEFIQRFMRETASVRIDRGTRWRAMRSLCLAGIARPALMAAALSWGLSFAWRARRDLWAARGQVHKLTLFTHNFMDACSLDPERIDACVFMAMTQDGPMSMCAYNARRDDFLLRPLQTSSGLWQPLRARPSGSLDPAAASGKQVIATFPVKWLKGRSRAAAQARGQGAPSAAALAISHTEESEHR